MTKRQRGKNEIVCMCNAYDHPHRLGGGRCNGSAWCLSFRSIDSFECISCNLNNNDQCDVVSGAESINNEHCECVANEIRSRSIEDEYGHLPLDVDDYMTKKMLDYYDNCEERL